tara:strand:- start:1239 stop:1469 length:231 start_codon:yes stop_codon:yes gene_type:complete
MAKKDKKASTGALEEAVNTPVKKSAPSSGGMSPALRKQVIRAHWHLVEECIASGASAEAIAKLPNGTREQVRRAYA